MDSINLSHTRLNAVDTVLKLTARFWFALAFLSQGIMAYYVAFFYGPPAIRGDMEVWNTTMPHGYISGDTMGNLVMGAHLLMAVMVLLGGPLQIIPQVRNYAPKFHRWNGRIYIFNAFIMGLGGLYLVWVRGAVGTLPGHIGITLNAVLLMLFATMALRMAMARKFDQHFRWVLRLFLAMSGVWMFRVGMMFWVFINGGPVGFDPETVTGPFITFITFGMYLIPLTVLELYFYVQRNAGLSARLGMVVLLLACSVITGVGTFIAVMGMWLPKLAL